MDLKRIFKNSIISLLPKGLQDDITRPYRNIIQRKNEREQFVNLSFSQEGEDLVLRRLMDNKNTGFYVDIGAHHPYRFSNTYKFYLLGWKGINIDPLPNTKKLFDKVRPNDINIEAAISSNPSNELVYHVFDEPAVNTFDTKLVEHWSSTSQFKLLEKIILSSYKLSDILDQYLPVGQEIDFMSIDVEGMDLEVLQSNDWHKYLPKYIVVESLYTNFEKDMQSPLSTFLTQKGYHIIAKTVNSLFFSKL